MRLPFVLRVVRAVYSLALYALLPVILYHLVWRGFRHRDYLRRWGERFGFIPDPPAAPVIWLHAVSVGEVNAAVPLVRALLARYPDHSLAITCFTPTGSERVRALWGDRVWHAYAPYDLPDAVQRFLGRLDPALAVIMETEIWPNLFYTCRRFGIPLVIANARLSERSLRGYAPVREMIATVLDCAHVLAAQSQADAERFRRLGAGPESVHAVGNLKYELRLPDRVADIARDWRRRFGERPVWIAASTHELEEAAVLAMHARIREEYPQALLLWAPRHPERFRHAVAAARAAGWRVSWRSRHGLPEPDCDCFVIDSLGELLGFYACADIAFVGGSLQPVGGHNLLEPAALAVPAVVGPHTFNFEEITARLAQAGAIRQEAGVAAVTETLLALLADPAARLQMGRAGAGLVAHERGAAARTVALIETCYRPA